MTHKVQTEPKSIPPFPSLDTIGSDTPFAHVPSQLRLISSGEQDLLLLCSHLSSRSGEPKVNQAPTNQVPTLHRPTRTGGSFGVDPEFIIPQPMSVRETRLIFSSPGKLVFL